MDAWFWNVPDVAVFAPAPAVPPGCVELAKLVSAATMARSVAASFTASAFLSGTTQMLPGRA
ncbi:hypothetical protein D3C81_1219960 [compost metagenome]